MSATTSTKTNANKPAKIANVRLKLSDKQGAGNVNARFDSAQTNSENIKHWQYADALSAMAAMSPGVRQTLRNRARYEVDNNGSIDGAIDRLANYVVGTGPRLQVMTEDREFNRRYQREFKRWAKRIGLARKLRLAVRAQTIDGEVFGRYFTNPPLKHKVKLDFKLVESEQVKAPYGVAGPNPSDGIVFDDYGNPLAYTMLNHHPGDQFGGMAETPDSYRADDVFHLYHHRRVGQTRGVTRLVATLPLYAQLRRYRLSVLAAAETAADLAVLFKTQQSPEDPDELEPLDTIEIQRRMAMTMPMGWDAYQLKAEQPTTTFAEFSDNISSEASQPLQMPQNVAQAKSAGYNFASAKIDLMLFAKANDISTDDIRDLVLDPMLEKWHAEAARIPGLLDGVEDMDAPPEHDWFWDVQDLLDPREAQSKATLIGNGMMTFQEYFGDRGMNADTEHETMAKSLGLTIDEYRARLADKLLGPEVEEVKTTPDSGDDDEDAA